MVSFNSSVGSLYFWLLGVGSSVGCGVWFCVTGVRIVGKSQLSICKQITRNDSQFSPDFLLVACENLILASREINKPNLALIGFMGFNLKANGLYKVLVNK